MVLVNGNPIDSIPADDRGLAYGDGLFETIEISQGQPLLWRRHLMRLKQGCEVLGMACHDDEVWLNDCLKLADGQEHAIIKLMLTRGSGGRGYRPDAHSQTRRMVSLHSWPVYPQQYVTEGVRLFKCRTPVTENSRLAGLKTLCRLEQVMAQMEWQEPEFDEGLMLTEAHEVIEGTRSNVFIIKNGVLLTPELKRAGIKGIMRDVIIEMATKSGMIVKEAVLDHQAFIDADEVFLCNSIIKIWPVKEYLGKYYGPGACTKSLATMVSNHLGDYE